MAVQIVCTPHNDKNKLVYGKRYEVEIKVTSSDGTEEGTYCGTFELCEPDARPITSTIEYVQQINLANKVDATPAAVPAIEIPDTFRCGLCMNQTTNRGTHANKYHGKKPHEIVWQPLFDTSEWKTCSCGYPLKTDSGLYQHQKTTGHKPADAPYPLREEEFETATGKAALRAVDARN